MGERRDTHKQPVMNVKLTPIFSPVRNCVCQIATSGSTSKYRSVPHPATELATAMYGWPTLP